MTKRLFCCAAAPYHVRRRGAAHSCVPHLVALWGKVEGIIVQLIRSGVTREQHEGLADFAGTHWCTRTQKQNQSTQFKLEALKVCITVRHSPVYLLSEMLLDVRPLEKKFRKVCEVTETDLRQE